MTNSILDQKLLLDSLNDAVYIVDKERKIIYWNPSAERITGYTAGEVQDSHCWDNLLLHVDTEGNNLCKTTCPLMKTIKFGEKVENRLYLRHKEGFRIPVLIRTVPLFDDDGNIEGAYEIFREDFDTAFVAEKLEKLQRLALVDSLTGIANRHYLEETLEVRISEHRRYGWTFGVLFLDIDWFKEVNDSHGHECGDSILKTVAKTIIHNIRNLDSAGRWGGDEFLILLPNISDKELETIASRIRVLVEKSTAESNNKEISVTISIGGTLVREDDTEKTILARADGLLYKCKASGKNTILIEQ
ncbi:MAG: diguanylate cyclase [bacterium]